MTAPLRPAAYLRVSSAEQVAGYSLDQQERAIRDYARAHGWAEPTVYVDAGRSAFTDKTEKRPQFAAMLDAAEAGEHDVIIVHKLDRFARSLVTTLRELQRLESVRVGFVSIGEQMDFTTPIGRVILSVLGAFAEYYSRNLSTEVKKGLAGRKAAGYRHSSLPYGARLVDGGPAIEVDPTKAPHLARILDRAAALPADTAALALNAEGIPSRRGGPWHGPSLRVLVRSARWLLDQPSPWPDRYRAAFERRPSPPVRHDRRTRLLTGLLRCGECGGRLIYAGVTAKGGPGVQCHRGPREPRGCLPGAKRKTYAAHYERAVLDWVAAFPSPWQVQRAAVRLASRADPALSELDTIRIQRQRVKAQHDAGLIDDEQMFAESALLNDRERAIAPRLPDVFRLATELAALVEALPALEPDAGNAALRVVLDSVVVRGRSVEIVPTPEVAALLREAVLVAAVA